VTVESPSFLHVDLAVTGGGFAPVLRSSVVHRHRAVGARLELRDGWLVPTAVPGEERALARVAVSDVSQLGKLELRSDARPGSDRPLEVVAVGPGHWHVLCRPAELVEVRTALAARGLVIDRTAGWNVIGLAGPEASTLLRRLSPVRDVPARGPVAGVPGTILARPGGFWLVVSQELALHVWDLALDLAAPLGGGAAGADAAWGADPLLASAAELAALTT
jgi:glycine cleavage system aminomethyltransferase T